MTQTVTCLPITTYVAVFRRTALSPGTTMSVELLRLSSFGEEGAAAPLAGSLAWSAAARSDSSLYSLLAQLSVLSNGSGDLHKAVPAAGPRTAPIANRAGRKDRFARVGIGVPLYFASVFHVKAYIHCQFQVRVTSGCNGLKNDNCAHLMREVCRACENKRHDSVAHRSACRRAACFGGNQRVWRGVSAVANFRAGDLAHQFCAQVGHHV